MRRFGGELLAQLQQQQVFSIGLNISWLGFGTKAVGSGSAERGAGAGSAYFQKSPGAGAFFI